MIYTDFKGKRLSRLGFGAMRLPVDAEGKIDENKTAQMIDSAFCGGINYFDTAYPYHEGHSELVVGEILSYYPRESFYIADKYPGHQINDTYKPSEIFEHQLKKCRVDYFDFYLMHNVYENSIAVYKDKRWGIVDYFVEQKRRGKIHHLGFSCHGDLSTMKEFMDYCGREMEFCQIQLNYLDWTLQDAKSKYEYFTSIGVPVWVMEPLRGGRLADLGSDNDLFKKYRADESVASWAFRWLLLLDNTAVILSGMSDMSQLKNNLDTFSNEKPLSCDEVKVLFDIAAKLGDNIPCTGCGYCKKSCIKSLDIPLLIKSYNELLFEPKSAVQVGMRIDALSVDKLPSACIACGKCVQMCPQKIDIPKLLAAFSYALDDVPKWTDICKIREEAAKKIKQK